MNTKKIGTTILLLLAALAGFYNCHSIATKLEINAPAETVWREFQNTKEYEKWNPFMRIEGEFKTGTTLKVELKPEGGEWMEFNPVVLKANEREFIWRGRFLMPGIFTGEHEFRMEIVNENKVIFHQNESFNGILVPIFNFDSTISSFEAMNQALKERVETKHKNR